MSNKMLRNFQSCVEMLKDQVNEIRLYPLLVAVLAAATTLGTSNRAIAQTSDRSQTIASSSPFSQPSITNVIVPTISVPQFSPTEPAALQQPISTPKLDLAIKPSGQQSKASANNAPTTAQASPSNVAQNPQPQPTIPTTLPGISTPPSPSEPRVLVAEVVVKSADGKLAPNLQDEVYRVIRTQPGRAATRSQLDEDVKAIYALGYFSKADAISEDTPLGVRVTFLVQINPVLQQVTVSNVPTTSPRVIPDKVGYDLFTPLYGKTLNQQELQDAGKNLNKWYKDNGYELAQVVEAPKVSADGKVTLVVAEGVIEEIKVRFLNKKGEAVNSDGTPIQGRTREFIITREIQTKPGQVFNRNFILRDLRRLAGLGIFEVSQESPSLSLDTAKDPNKVVIVVNIIEKNTGSVAAGAGISSASGLFGTVSYQEQNLGGNNQKLGAELQVGQRELLFDLNFTDPWIAGDPYRTSYNVNAFQRRTISLIFDGGTTQITLPNGEIPRVLRFGGGVTFSRPLTPDPFAENPEWRASLGLQYQRVSITDSGGNITPKDKLGNDLSFSKTGQDDLLSLQLGVVNDRRNDPLRPTQGSILRFGADQSIPIGLGNIFMNRLRGSYSYYLPVKFTNFSEGVQTLAFNLQGGTVLGDLPPYEAFALGGSNSVRGYDEGTLGAGRSYIQATAEYRFPLFSILDAAMFVDVGSDLGTASSVPGNPAAIRGKPGQGYGYGLGVRVQTPLGPIRVDYGINDRGEGRIHFGIGEKF